MHAYVISLARREDRRARISARLKTLGISFSLVNALDARTSPLMPHGTQVPLPLACAWYSHVKAAEALMAGGHEYALILEDDAVPAVSLNWSQFGKDMPHAMAEADLDYLQVGFISAAYRGLNFTNIAPGRQRRELAPLQLAGRVRLADVGVSRAGAHAYVLSRSLASLLPLYNNPAWVGPDGFFDRFASAGLSEGYLRLASLRKSLVEQESRATASPEKIDSDNFPNDSTGPK